MKTILNLDEINKQNKNLLNILYKRYGQGRSIAYNCLLVDYKTRVRSIYDNIRSGKLKLDDFEVFVEDFIGNHFDKFDASDVEQMIKFVKSLR